MLEKQHIGGWSASGNAEIPAVNFPRLPGLRRGGGAGSFRGVDLSRYRKMDPHLLLGLVNTELRNHCDSLEDLVKTHDLDEEILRAKLQEGGYEYQSGQNQFR